MSDYAKALLEERNKANAAAREIVDRAIAEKRALTAEDNEAIARADADFEAKNTMLAELRKIEAREAEIRAAVADAPEARPVVEHREMSDESETLRKLMRGEIRSYDFEQRDVTKSSTGAPIPTLFYDRIIEVARWVGPMLEVGTTLQTSSGANLQIPRTNAYSTGTVQSEGGTFGESDPTFQSFLTLGAFKESVLFQVSREALEDDGANLQEYLATNIGQAIGYVVNNHLTVGTGTTQPTGLVPSAGSGVTGGTGVSGAFTYANVVDLVYSTDAAVRRMPGFGIMGSTTAISALRKLVDTTGQPLWQPALIIGQPDRLLGYPVIENPHMAAVATSAKSLVAGDLKSFLIRQVGGIRVETSDDFAFNADLRTFKATMRVDSGLPQSSHIKYFIGNAA